MKKLLILGAFFVFITIGNAQTWEYYNTYAYGLCVLRNGTTAIETVTSPQPQLALYPNPATNTLYFPELQGKTFVEIFDTQGKLLLSRSLSQNNIDISSLCAGIYFVKTKNEQGNFVNKIVKE